jgi:hypothetical protein
VITDDRWAELLRRRAFEPGSVSAAWAARRRRPLLRSAADTLFLVAADHPARGALAVGGDRLAMADRRRLLTRLLTALAHPRVDGVLGTPDVLDELVLLGALESKLAFGSLNRGGIAGAVWELDDPVTGHDIPGVLAQGLDGLKMLLRLDLDDPGTLATITACAAAVGECAAAGVTAMVEPLPYHRVGGQLVLDKSAESLVRAVTVTAGLGSSSAHTWLKLPAWPATPQACAASTLPVVVLGGSPSGDLAADLASWGRALAEPTVRGLVVGRTLLYPDDGDVHAAVDAAAQVLAAS